MRACLVVLVLLLVTLSGCLDGAPGDRIDPGGVDPNDRGANGTAGGLDAYIWNGIDLLQDEVMPLAIPNGTRWTYANEGEWALDDTLTVIAFPDDDGYVFGAGTREELANAIIWGQYWYGPMDAGLNPRGLDMVLFEWPLFDGKTFVVDDLPMMVIADVIETAAGTYPGFRIEGANEDIRVAYDYVPALGYMSQYEYGTADGSAIWEALFLTGMDDAERALGFEPGPYFYAGAGGFVPGLPDANAATNTVPEGFDSLVAVGIGSGKGSGELVHAGASEAHRWSFETSGLWEWRVGIVPATPGQWHLAVQTEADTWISSEVRAVNWLTYDATNAS